jgi:hypothetical protein
MLFEVGLYQEQYCDYFQAFCRDFRIIVSKENASVSCDASRTRKQRKPTSIAG